MRFPIWNACLRDSRGIYLAGGCLWDAPCLESQDWNRKPTQQFLVIQVSCDICDATIMNRILLAFMLRLSMLFSIQRL